MQKLLKEKNWQYFHDNYTEIHISGLSEQFLIRKNRIPNLEKYIKDVFRAYKTAQRQHEEWRKREFNPIMDQLKALAVNKKIIFHVKPTHKFEMYKDHNWWEYKLDNEDARFGWSYSYSWCPEPKEKLHHSLGQKFYEMNYYIAAKYFQRIFILKELLKGALSDFVYSKYSYEWLRNNHIIENEKLLKIQLENDEFWYRIGINRHGVPIWENFIWQNNETEIFEL